MIKRWKMKKSLGIYIHIPFCVRKCAYCDFCSFPRAGEHTKGAYAQEISRRIADASHGAREYRVDTVYFGGGTPSLMSARDVERMLGEIFRGFDVDGGAEITLECNPATADRAYFEAIRRMGVNRLSMGLQSASDRELKLLGRIHTAEDFIRTFGDAREAGFDNISADLMYGIPEQTQESLKSSIDTLVGLSPEHISAYGLMIEEGTDFYRRRHTLDVADDDEQYEMYMLCTHRLAEAGYKKYEISNFSRDGKRSRHNTRYWLGEEYLGFGVAAHSYFGGRRYGNSRDMEAFLRGEDITEESYVLDSAERLREYVMLRLRLAEGIDTLEYERIAGKGFFEAFPTVRQWISAGLMKQSGEHVSFTDRGFFVSNAILSEMLDFE